MLACAVVRRNRLWLTSAGLLLVCLAFLVEPFRSVLAGLPGMSVSRFHYTDFRGLIHLSLITAACANLADLADLADEAWTH